MKRKSLKLFVSLNVILVLCCLSFGATAKEVYVPYNYDSWGNSENVPGGYSYGGELSAPTGFEAPKDLYYDGMYIYVLENKRIAIFDKTFNFVRYIDEFYTVSNGEKNDYQLNSPSGIFVSANGKYAIADTGNENVVICNNTGEISNILTKPKEDNFPSELTFSPTRVAIDDMDNVYVLSKGFYYGAIVYNAEGNCTGFFGSNKVKVSASMLADMFWRKFMNKKQLEYSKSYVPVAFSSMDIDANNFIYTCTADTEKAIRKLNYLGNDIFETEQGPDPLDKSVYGDRKVQLYDGNNYYTAFCDIAVSEDNFVYALDSTKGRVFEYDQSSNLLNVFAAKGDQKGTFSNPTALETVGDYVLILDSDKAKVYIYRLTEYGKSLHLATLLYNEGRFTESEKAWNDVLKYNTNSELIYRSIGRAKLQQEDYKGAMYYARLGQDRLGFSKAFRIYRSESVRKYFVVFIIALLLFIIVVAVYKKITQKRGCNNKTSDIKLSLKNIIFHPLLLYESEYEKKGTKSIISCLIIVLFFFLGQVMRELATGFIFNKNNITQFNAVFVFLQSVGIIILWTISDMVVGSLRFGHGTVKRVFTGTAIAFVPYTLSIYINIILSQILTYEESAIMSIVSTIGILYTAILLYQSVRIMQQYSVKETCVSIVLDILIAIVILLLAVIIFMLVRQVTIFAATISNELLYRMN